VYAFPGTTIKSYIVAGGGAYNTKLDVAGSKSENHLGLNAGAGFTFGLGPIASFIESRYHFISREPSKGGVIHFVTNYIRVDVLSSWRAKKKAHDHAPSFRQLAVS